ncbi:amylo-alpha-1,6-glucosidase [Pedococcus sp. 5OH_020]|uniref:amylo-alpha-1,6-glucosidase n=1 Tax=Pedococcus sp. 5OH_020 TaxID=2989814 RepID=UPI0022EA0E63|nr:glycogen debranching N-terminal domain-containing protein [Pedococcus sp. 5OH_020]
MHGNATALSAFDGDMSPQAAQGLFVDDERLLSRLQVLLGDESASPVAATARGARAEFFGAVRGLGDPGADPTVEIRRSRLLYAATMVEDITVVNRSAHEVDTTLLVRLAADGAPIADVKSGAVGAPAVRPWVDAGRVVFETGRHRTTAGFEPPADALDLHEEGAVARFDVAVPPGRSRTIRVTVAARRTRSTEFDADPGSDGVRWDSVHVEADDARLRSLVEHSLDDLRHLLLRDPQEPEDVFAAAGSPWYLTLFGRDSLWAARMMLPFGTELAAGTLRAHARRQGSAEDDRRAEQPGKIAHEVRRTAYDASLSGLALPPLYFGTVDATALWVTLLVEAWRWGLPEVEVRELLPNLTAALGWITGPGQPDADGFLKYLDSTGHGLANQGWKDSKDSMRMRDGRIARAPIALVEAQGYAVQALLGAADLLEALAEPGADRARAEAAVLAQRLREAFWVDGGPRLGRYLAMALDGDGRRVDGLGSNMGHLLGSGALTSQEAALVARAVTGSELLDDFGVRTLGRDNGGFNPIGYHTGSVWTHDSAIIALGLAREGFSSEAVRVARALLASGEAFGYRWPELYAGEPMLGRPAPYPASCRPQAWAAASAGALLTVALGLRADVPAGLLHVAPPTPGPFGALRLSGLRVGDAVVQISANRAGEVGVTGLPDGMRVVGSA